MQAFIRSLQLAIPAALKRSRNPWNWCLRRTGAVVLGLALGFKSFLLFATGAIVLAASLFDLHMPEMRYRLPWRLMRLERGWLESPWSWRKRTQAAMLAILTALLLWSLAVGDLALILVAVLGGAMLWIDAAQRALIPWEYDKDFKEEETSAEADADSGESSSPTDGWIQ